MVSYENLTIGEAIELIQKDSLLIRDFPERLKNSLELAKQAVVIDGTTIKYFSNEIRNNKEIALSAVQNNLIALSSVSDELKKDKFFMMEYILPIIKDKYDVEKDPFSIRDLIERKQTLSALPSLYAQKFKESEKTIGNPELILNNYLNQGMYTSEFIEQLPDNIVQKLKVGSNLNDIVTNLEFYYYANKANYHNGLFKLLELMKNGFIPSYSVFSKISLKDIAIFDKNKWFKLAGYKLFGINNDSKVALVELMYNMGLFLDDNHANKRMETMQKLINSIPFDIKTEELELMKSQGVNVDPILKNYKLAKKSYYLVNTLTEADILTINHLPNQVADGSLRSRFMNLNTGKIKSVLTRHDYEALLNHVNNHISKEWLDKVCTYTTSEYYVLREKITFEEQEKIAACFVKSNNEHTFNVNKLTRIFKGTRMEYNEKFFKFFVKNFSDIISDLEYQSLMPLIINNFNEVANYYEQKSGRLSLEGFKAYFKGVDYTEIPKGFEEFAELCHQSGVSERDFSELAKLVAIQRKRKKSIIPNINVSYSDTVEDIHLNGRTLRLDDEITAVAGEKPFGNNCQVKGQKGESCMIHAMTTGSGRMFWVSDNKNRLIAQSWIWRNGDTLCFDNIERSNLFFDKEKKYKSGVIEIYKRAALAFIAESKKEIDKILETQKEKMDEYEYEKLAKHLEKVRIKKVTIGATRYGLNISDYFKEKMAMPKRPLDYGTYDYLDSDDQLIVISENNVYSREISTLEEYRDERIIKKAMGKNITNRIIYDIKQISKKYVDLFTIDEISKIYNADIDNLEVIVGDDWYVIYVVNNNEIIILDWFYSFNKSAEVEQNNFVIELQNQGIEIRLNSNLKHQEAISKLLNIKVDEEKVVVKK